jgi:hypothetical protein
LIGVQELGKVHREYKRWKIKPNAYCNLPIIRALRILWIQFFDEWLAIIVSKRSCQHLNQRDNLF